MSISRLRLLYIKQIIEEETDETHGLTLAQIKDKLKQQNGITADDKTLQSDMRALRDYYETCNKEFCMPSGKNHTYRFCGMDKDFTFQERMFLTDAVQTAKCLSEKQASSLLTKIGGSHGERFQNKIRLANHVRHPNGDVWRSMLIIQRAIEQDVQIRFRYFSYDVKRKKSYRNKDKDLIVNPYATVYSNGLYYMLAVATREKKVTAYQIDKMELVEMRSVPRRGKEIFERIKLGDYTKSVFGMDMGEEYGEPVLATLIFENRLVEDVLEQFGYDTFITPVDNEHFKVTVPVVESLGFFTWLFRFGNAVEIKEPRSLAYHFVQCVAKSLATFGYKGRNVYFSMMRDKDRGWRWHYDLYRYQKP